MKKIKITVVIVTKNRHKALFECLLALLHQTDNDFIINVIDNDSTDKTKEVVLKFKENLKIKHFLEKGSGYPTIYNAGIKTVKTRWVAFLDDDCIANVNWIKEIKEEIAKHPKIPAIIGYSDNFYPNNPYSSYMHFDHNIWQIRGTQLPSRLVTNYQILDNKNLALDLSIIKKHNLWFDEALCEFMHGRAEDGDFGMQLFSKGIPLIYSSKMKIYHKEPQGLKSFIKKITQKSLGTYLFNKKWTTHLPYIYQTSTINHSKQNQNKLVIKVFINAFSNIPMYKKIFFFILIPFITYYKNLILKFAFKYLDHYYKKNPKKIEKFVKKYNISI